MSEPILHPITDNAYKPISGLALGGLFLSTAYTGLVLLSAGVGVVKGAPIFYPLWILLLPAAGFVLCLVGRSQIIGPEATRAGLPVANWGLGLALFSGLGYGAYFLVVGMAVAAQANDFLTGDPGPDRGFLTHLQRGAKSEADVDIAFLLTKPASGRIKYRPGDDETLQATYDRPGMDAAAGELTRFRRSLLVRMLTRAGDQAVIEPLGIRDWEYEKGSYKVGRNYRIRMPEAVVDMALQAESTEGEAEGQLRQWSVNLNRSPIDKKELTPLGKTIEGLNEQGKRFLETEWRPRTRVGKAIADFAAFDKTDWKRLFPDEGVNDKNLAREHYQTQTRNVFYGLTEDGVILSYEAASWPAWGLDDKGRFWIDHPIRLTLAGGGASLPPTAAEGKLRLRTKKPLDPSKVTPPVATQEWIVDELTIQRARPLKGF